MKFDFRKHTLEVSYSDDFVIRFDDFTHQNQWGRWCEIPLFPDKQISQIIIIEKYLEPELIDYQTNFAGKYITPCPYRAGLMIAANECSTYCKHAVGWSKDKISCNYKTDTK